MLIFHFPVLFRCCVCLRTTVYIYTRRDNAALAYLCESDYIASLPKTVYAIEILHT